ncbi:MAG TPA: hypothetical protein VFF52_09425 [Isosphaeraceae bacterium]|nr:hypothetical protein [Isosphaeraceae bacterium]
MARLEGLASQATAIDRHVFTKLKLLRRAAEVLFGTLRNHPEFLFQHSVAPEELHPPDSSG